MNDLPTTGELLKQASDGDQHAWNELVNRFSSLLWSVGRAYRLDTAEATDAVQTTWLALLERLDRIEDPDRLARWLVTTMRRECLRILNRSDRGCPDSPDAVVLDRARRAAQLWQTLDQMPGRCHQLLRVLMTTPPPPHEVIAAMLDIPISSVGPTTQHCLDCLRRQLEQHQ
jgi:RNA polymerase sigma factor (sigma-70 family)